MLRIDSLARPHSVLIIRCCTLCAALIGTLLLPPESSASLFQTVSNCTLPRRTLHRGAGLPGGIEGAGGAAEGGYRLTGALWPWRRLRSLFTSTAGEPAHGKLGASSNADKAAESHPPSRPISFALQLSHSLRSDSLATS